jgi:hypothetical protein
MDCFPLRPGGEHERSAGAAAGGEVPLAVRPVDLWIAVRWMVD